MNTLFSLSKSCIILHERGKKSLDNYSVLEKIPIYTVTTFNYSALFSTADSMAEVCWMLTENKTTNQTTASSTAVILTFKSERRHVSVI